MDRLDSQIMEDFRAFIEEFKGETDRAIVVLTAARIDFLLYSILQKHLIPNASKRDEFFENQGPGSNFSNKILLAYRLGLVDADFARALNLVRRIRNDFAHETSACSLGKGSHKDIVGALTSNYKQYPFFDFFKDSYFKNAVESRADFMTVVGFIILRLTYLLNSVEQIDSEKAWHFLTDKMKQPIEKEKSIEEKTN